jgi:hypothetical protein
MTTPNEGPVIRPDTDLKPRFMRSDLRDPAFYAAHEADILAAAREGRIVDDVTATKPKWGREFGKVGL